MVLGLFSGLCTYINIQDQLSSNHAQKHLSQIGEKANMGDHHAGTCGLFLYYFSY